MRSSLLEDGANIGGELSTKTRTAAGAVSYALDGLGSFLILLLKPTGAVPGAASSPQYSGHYPKIGDEHG